MTKEAEAVEVGRENAMITEVVGGIREMKGGMTEGMKEGMREI